MQAGNIAKMADLWIVYYPKADICQENLEYIQKYVYECSWLPNSNNNNNNFILCMQELDSLARTSTIT